MTALAIILMLLTQSIDEAAIRQAVVTAIEARGVDAQRVEVEVLRVNGLRDADGTLRVEIPGDQAPRARTQVRIVLDRPDGPSESGWALVHVAHFDSVAVSTRSRTVGSALFEDDLSFEWMDVTAFRGRPLRRSDLSSLPSDAVWSRTIVEGRPVRLDDIRLPFAAETGDAVVMDYVRNGIVLRLSCRARESGSVGDVIRLYSPDTRTTYRARLTGTGTATWIETR